VPKALSPMLPVPARRPPAGPGWTFEFKWDGLRALAFVEGGRVVLRSRRGRSIGAAYPETGELGSLLGARRAILDGEVVALDERGRPSFERLQERLNVASARRVAAAARRVPVTYLLFDVCYLDGRSLLAEPYLRRRALLEELGIAGAAAAVPADAGRDGEAALAVAREAGIEGVVAKRDDSSYEPGRRSRAWVKVRDVRTQEVVVAGYTPGEAGRAGTIGALVLAVQGAAGLEYVGRVGSGMSEEARRELVRRLERLATGAPVRGAPPDVAVRWVEPSLVGEVEFARWTRAGRLRHPAWRGLRPDKRAEEVVRA